MTFATSNQLGLFDAAEQLAKSERGREALSALLKFADEQAVGLDALNQAAVIALLQWVWSARTGAALKTMREALLRRNGPVAADDARDAAINESEMWGPAGRPNWRGR